MSSTTVKEIRQVSVQAERARGIYYIAEVIIYNKNNNDNNVQLLC